MEQSILLSVDLWSGREKKKRETGMARKRAENREGSLGFPGFVKPVFTKDSKPLGRIPDVRFLGVIFDRRLTFLPHILHLRKRCEKSLHLLKVLSNTSWGADRTSLLRVYQAIVLSRIDYGCVAYGSACNSTLQKLELVKHMAMRISSGLFRTSPVQSLYVNCHQLPLDLRRRKLSLAYYFKILSVPSHPLQNVYMSTSMKRLYDARPSNILPFMDRMKLHLSELDLLNVHVQQRKPLRGSPSLGEYGVHAPEVP
ncbi:putative RNA-directed DNA polymerase from transposon X-element [Trichonephila clavipes]|nr:putative RNA-directed DNA polymerase from transposon X-element [Trichonephila clavipes]